MGYDFDTELFKVDFAMWTRDTEPKVPIIFVESENQANTANHEVCKLISLSAPLRVLISVIEWDETPGVWQSGGMRRHLLSQWQKTIGAYTRIWPRTGLFGLLIGEWRRDDVLRFYANAVDGTSALFAPEDMILLERQMR